MEDKSSQDKQKLFIKNSKSIIAYTLSSTKLEIRAK
jgi:hypothetical protein